MWQINSEQSWPSLWKIRNHNRSSLASRSNITARTVAFQNLGAPKKCEKGNAGSCIGIFMPWAVTEWMYSRRTTHSTMDLKQIEHETVHAAIQPCGPFSLSGSGSGMVVVSIEWELQKQCINVPQNMSRTDALSLIPCGWRIGKLYEQLFSRFQHLQCHAWFCSAGSSKHC